MNRKNSSKYTPVQRLAIIEEYETGTMTGAELAKKYGLKSGSTIAMWRLRLQNPQKNRIFAPENDTKVVDEKPMAEKTKAQLEAELAQAMKDLEWAKLQNKALNTLIDIAEEQGIQIRKKSGAKQ